MDTSGLVDDCSARPTYVWRKDGASLPAQGPTLAIESVSAADSGQYTCTLARRGLNCTGGGERGDVDADVQAHFTLGVAQAPRVRNGLVSGTLPIGGSYELRVNYTGGTPPPSFQWRKNGVDIRGGTRARLVIRDASPSDVGTYTCRVWNMAGEVEWEEAALGM